MTIWLRTDEVEEAISSLEMLQEVSSLILEDHYRWKWAILAVHASLQGFMVLALRHGNNLLVLREDTAKTWMEAHRTGGKYPEEKLDNFLNLYKKIKKDCMICYINSKKFEATPAHDYAVKKLNDLRNDFVHFIPKGWCIELSGLPEISLNCLEVVEFLVFQSGNILIHEDSQQARLHASLMQNKQVLNAIKNEYDKHE